MRLPHFRLPSGVRCEASQRSLRRCSRPVPQLTVKTQNLWSRCRRETQGAPTCRQQRQPTLDERGRVGASAAAAAELGEEGEVRHQPDRERADRRAAGEVDDVGGAVGRLIVLAVGYAPAASARRLDRGGERRVEQLPRHEGVHSSLHAGRRGAGARRPYADRERHPRGRLQRRHDRNALPVWRDRQGQPYLCASTSRQVSATTPAVGGRKDPRGGRHPNAVSYRYTMPSGFFPTQVSVNLLPSASFHSVTPGKNAQRLD